MQAVQITRFGAQPRVQWMLDSITGSAAFVANGRRDIVATNTLRVGAALTAVRQHATTGELRPAPVPRPEGARLLPGLGRRANITVALLRAEAGRRPNDTQLRELVGELSTVSEKFRVRWAARNVRIRHNGAKRFPRPVVGALDLGYCTLDLPTDDHSDLRLTIYTADPGPLPRTPSSRCTAGRRRAQPSATSPLR